MSTNDNSKSSAGKGVPVHGGVVNDTSSSQDNSKDATPGPKPSTEKSSPADKDAPRG